MTNFESEEKVIAAPQRRVFDRLSDLQFLEGLKDRLPAAARSFTVTDGCLSITTPMGDVSFKVVETQPFASIRYQSVTSPVPFGMVINLLPSSAQECRMKIVAELDINSFMAGMVSGPIKNALNQMGEALAKIPY